MRAAPLLLILCAAVHGLPVEENGKETVGMFVSSSLVSVGLTGNATYRAMLSKEVAPSAQATAQAVLSAVENMAKVLGILLHTTIFVATFSSLSPSFVYFLMTGEAFLLLGLVRWLVKSRRHDYVVL